MFFLAKLRTSEEGARQVMLVRAIETEDGDALVLTRDDRSFATAAALSEHPLSEAGAPRETGAFLVRRAELALSRLDARYPRLRQTLTLSRWPRWLGWSVPLAALAVGLGTNVIEGNRLNIVAFPLLGMLAWNLLVYLWLAGGAIRRRLLRRAAGHPLLSWVEKLVRPAAAGLAGQPTLERGVARFARDWALAAGPLTRARTSRTLHLAAALFAIGVLAGMIARARYAADYSAGWEGTWAGAEHEIAWLLDVILGPAGALTGIPIPDAARLRELRGGSENAGSWLILWSVTALLFVVIPRMLLAMVAGARAALLRRQMAIPGHEDFYVRTLLRNALGKASVVRVVPYGFDPSAEARERLERLLAKSLGDSSRIRIEEAVPYGAEDEWLAAQGSGLQEADQLLLLFGLASTPEAENHGAFAAAVADRVRNAAGLTLLLEESGYRHRMRGQASAERRMGDRVAAWKSVLAPTGLDPVVVNLELGEDEVGARLLERALYRSAVPA